MTGHRHDVGIWQSGIDESPYIASCLDCPFTADATDRDRARAAAYRHMDDTAEETA